MTETTSAFANPTNPGAKNIYCCDACRRHIVTRDLHRGTTPFVIGCQVTPGCTGKMYSSLYRVFDPKDMLMPSHEWYKPGVAEIIKPHLAEHVSKGGLLLRPLSGKSSGGSRLVRHKERGTTYRVIGAAQMQASDWFRGKDALEVDGAPVIVYEGEDGQLWVRPREEFQDGRFEDV